MFRNFKKELFELRNKLPGEYDKHKQSYICETIVSQHDLEFLQYAHEKQHYHLTKSVLVSAIKTGLLPMITYVITKLSPINWKNIYIRNIYRIIVENDYFDILSYLVDNGLPMNKYLIEAAAFYGNLKMIKYAFEKNCVPNHVSLSCAVESGREDIVDFLLEKGVVYHSSVMTMSIQKQNLSMITFLQRKGYSLQDIEITYTSLEIATYLYTNNCIWDRHFYLHATYNNDDKLITFALQHGCPVTDNLLQYLIRFEKIELLDYIYNNNNFSLPANVLCMCYSRKMIDYFVEKGFLPSQCLVIDSILHESYDILDWALNQTISLPYNVCLELVYRNAPVSWLERVHSRGGILTYECYYYATKAGNMDMLDYLRRNNCPWNIGIYEGAVASRDIDVFLYVKKYFLINDYNTLYRLAIQAGNRNVLFYLLSEKAPTISFLFLLCERCLLDMIPYFLQNNMPYTGDDINKFCSILINTKKISLLYQISRYITLTPRQNKHVSRYLRRYHVLESYLLKDLVKMCIEYI